MESIRFVQAALLSAAVAIFGAPTLALAQSAPKSSGGGGWFLLLIFGGLTIGITAFTISQRKKGGNAKKEP